MWLRRIDELQAVERARHPQAAPVQDVRVDHRRADVAVAQQLLDGSDVVAVFEEVGCEGMTEGMAAGVLDDSGAVDRFVHRAYPLHARLPWDFIDHSVDKRYLLAERRKAFTEQQTPPCDTATCHACSAC